ncbi:unnamed protein product, partial [Rotaria socialis]
MSIHTHFEDLSNEIFFEIFDYLQVLDVFTSLNERISSILQSIRLRINILNTHYDRDLDFLSSHLNFHAHQVLSLKCYDTIRDRSSIISLLFQRHNFINLQSCQFISVKPSTELDNVIKQVEIFLHYNYVYLDLSTYTSIASNLISLDLLISGSPNTVSVYSILPIPRVCHRIRYLHAIIKHEIPSENNNVNCPSDLIVNCSKQFGDMIRHLTSILLRSVPSDNSDASIEQFNDDYYKFLIHWTSLLSSMLKCSSNDSTIISIKRFIVQHLYDLTLNANLLNFMKTIPNLIPMLLQMTDIEQDETQLNIYRCLGKLMTEADIKAMETSSKIASIHLKFLTNTIDNPKRKDRFHSILQSLKNFVQHDQVKVELIKQNILPLLIRCIIETKFDPINVQKVVLKILLALSFNDDASTILKQNKDFMSQVRNLANNTNVEKSNLQRAAEGLLWKLEKEAVAITKSASSRSFKYDVMISYSHSDHPLCYQIHERLVQDGFNVWIDRDQMHGAPMIAMADAVENSEFVLLCMSDTYKQSVYCQSEAHYAFERRCRLIPLIMKSHYKPDGWLGIMVSGKIYVDFMKNEFKLAYNKLKTEIDQYRQQNLNHSMVKSKGKNPQDVSSTISKSVQKPSKSTERPAIVNLPCCIIQWTNNHVQSFFLTNELDNTMLLLCLRLDGCCLLQLYEMCMMNRESMYQSLKAELADVHHTTLPISDYLTFLHQIKRYVPLTPVVTKTNQSPFPPSTVCNL